MITPMLEILFNKLLKYNGSENKRWTQFEEFPTELFSNVVMNFLFLIFHYVAKANITLSRFFNVLWELKESWCNFNIKQ